jgi:hypothetical protein
MSDTKEIWKKRVASWRASGETAEKYSAGRGWSAGTLLWWSSKLGREAPPPAVRLAQLVRSPVPRDRGDQRARSSWNCSTRVRVTVDPGADREAVVTILGLLAARVERPERVSVDAVDAGVAAKGDQWRRDNDGWKRYRGQTRQGPSRCALGCSTLTPRFELHVRARRRC